MWWTRSEQPVRTAIWFNTVSTAFTGIVSYAIGLTNTGVARWRLLFLVIGGFTVIWACLLWIFLPDSPVSSWQLSDREKWVAIQRVKDNNTGVEDVKFKWYQVRELLADPKTWLLVIFAAAQNVPNGENSESTLLFSQFSLMIEKVVYPASPALSCPALDSTPYNQSSLTSQLVLSGQPSRFCYLFRLLSSRDIVASS